MPRKRYSTEFKKEAVSLMKMEGLSASEVSEKLGLSTNLLHSWKGQHLQELTGDKLEAHMANPHEMAKEIERLRKHRLLTAARVRKFLKAGYALPELREEDELAVEEAVARIRRGRIE